MGRVATAAVLLLLVAGCPVDRAPDNGLECGEGTFRRGDECLPIPDDDDATTDDDDNAGDDDDAAGDDDDAAGDDDDAADDDDATDDDDDDAAGDDDDSVPDPISVGVCNDLKAFENIVELHVTPLGSDPLDEFLQGGQIAWYACAWLQLPPYTYTIRVVDEFDWQYQVDDLLLEEDGFEYWFSYADQI